jgi:hypothetical protein
VTLLQTSPVSYSGRGGSAREYVDTDFSPVDGARPYVKPTYQSRNGWAEIKGYLERDELPKDVPINLALAIDLAPADAASGPVDRPQLERAHETVAYLARELNVRNRFRSSGERQQTFGPSNAGRHGSYRPIDIAVAKEGERVALAA